jgi:hypothetical protein
MCHRGDDRPMTPGHGLTSAGHGLIAGGERPMNRLHDLIAGGDRPITADGDCLMTAGHGLIAGGDCLMTAGHDLIAGGEWPKTASHGRMVAGYGPLVRHGPEPAKNGVSRMARRTRERPWRRRSTGFLGRRSASSMAIVFRPGGVA